MGSPNGVPMGSISNKRYFFGTLKEMTCRRLTLIGPCDEMFQMKSLNVLLFASTQSDLVQIGSACGVICFFKLNEKTQLMPICVPKLLQKLAWAGPVN